MYLHSILQKDSKELVRRIYDAQKANTSPGDFVELIAEDKAAINLSISEEQIKSLKKAKFKLIVRNKIRIAACKSLNKIKENHSKMNGLVYTKLEKASYLSSPLFNNENVKLLLALRTRTVKGIKNDFRGMYQDNLCPLSCDTPDTLQHLLECPVLQQYHTSQEASISDIRYTDVFSENVRKQKQATKLYSELLEIRNRIVNNQPEISGPVHSLQTVQESNHIITA